MNTMHVRRSRGVTLIEVVAALGILAVGIVGLLTLFPLGIDASNRAGDRTTAAILGEYVIESIRLQQREIEPTDGTREALNALEWDDYEYDDKQFTFIDPEDLDFPASKNFGTGEQIVVQDASALTDREHYSRYEVTIRFTEIIQDVSGGSPVYSDAFTDGAGVHLMQATVTVRWPRAFSDEERKQQNTMVFVTYLRPGAN